MTDPLRGDVRGVTGIILGLLAGLTTTLWAGHLALGVRGRISADNYRTWIRSPAFAALSYQLWTRRAHRSAVTGQPGPLARHADDFRQPHYLRAHHWTYRNLGREPLWQLVLVTLPEHQRIHDWSVLLFGNKNRGLWLTTAAVVGWGKLTRRHHPTSGPSAGPHTHEDLTLPPPGPAARGGVRAGRSHRPPSASSSPQAPMTRPSRAALPPRSHPAKIWLPCPPGWREHPPLLGLVVGLLSMALAGACQPPGSGPPTPPPSTLSRQAGPDTSRPQSGAPTTRPSPPSSRPPVVAVGCPLGSGCPRPELTRGTVIPSTVGVCQTSFNPRRELTAAAKRRVLAGYGFDPSVRVAEWDHLVARWAGGTSTSGNVWPQLDPAERTRKDRLEERLYLAVCRGSDTALATTIIRAACAGAELDLPCAQQIMRTFWRWW